MNALDKIEAEERKKQFAENLKSSNEQLQQAEKRAEVDPFGLFNSRLSNARALLSAGDKEKGWAQLRQALEDYRKMPPSNVDYNVSRTLWESFTNALRYAETKADEQIIYGLVDAEVEKIAGDKKRDDSNKAAFVGKLSEITRYFTDKHRNDAAIEFLEYARKQSQKLRANNLGTYITVSGQLRQQYQSMGDTDKALAVAKEQIDSLTQQDATTAGYLLDIAAYYAYTEKFELARPVIDRVILIVQTNPESFGKYSPLHRFDNVIHAYERKKRPQETEQLVRKMIDAVSKNKSAFSRDGSWVNDSVRVASKELSDAGEYENAEALIAYAQSAVGSLDEDMNFSRELTSIYLRHAGKLLTEGKKAQAKKFLALSEEQFNRMLSRYTQERDIEMQKQYRQAELKKYGLTELSGK